MAMAAQHRPRAVPPRLARAKAKVASKVKAHVRLDAPRFYQWFTVCYLMLVWCLFLLAPFDTFESTAAFSVLLFYGTEQETASMAGAIATLSAFSLAWNSRRLRKASFILSAVFLAFVSWSFFLGNPGGTGWLANAIVAAFILLALWLME